MVGEDSHGITNIIEKLIVIVAGFLDPLFFSSHQELKNSHLILNVKIMTLTKGFYHSLIPSRNTPLHHP